MFSDTNLWHNLFIYDIISINFDKDVTKMWLLTTNEKKKKKTQEKDGKTLKLKSIDLKYNNNTNTIQIPCTAEPIIFLMEYKKLLNVCNNFPLNHEYLRKTELSGNVRSTLRLIRIILINNCF